MEHSVITYTGFGIQYSWQRAEASEPSKRLRSFYKSHPGIIRFLKFPLKHRLWLERELYTYPVFRDRMEPIVSRLYHFDAEVWDIEVEATPHPLREERPRGRYWVQPKISMLHQHFMAPFQKSNEGLVLSSDVPLKIVNSDSALILLDWCQEQGAKINRDFELTKREQYIVLKSDDIRLMLVEKIEEWPEVNLTFTISHPEFMSYTVTIDDLK